MRRVATSDDTVRQSDDRRTDAAAMIRPTPVPLERVAMRIVAADRLTEVVAAVMEGAGCRPAEARTVARRLVDSNLVGHDSHGVLRVSKYLEWMREGNLLPNRTPSLVFDSDTIAIVDGQRGFGQVIGEYAGTLGAKASRTGIALVGLRNCGHLGRLGDWAELAAAAGLVSMHFLNAGAQRGARSGAVTGACPRIRSASAFPRPAGAVILDITTSTVAEGKLMVAMNKGEQVPEGWIVDANGTPTTDPKDFYAGGALLTIGGHKGSGLSIITDLLAGALTLGRSSDPDDTAIRNNMLSIYIAPAVYDPSGEVYTQVHRFVEWVRPRRRHARPARARARRRRAGDARQAAARRRRDRRHHVQRARQRGEVRRVGRRQRGRDGVSIASRTAAALFALLAVAVPAWGELFGRVVAVHDGDTISILVAGRPLRVRLAGIDAPERGSRFPTPPGMRSKAVWPAAMWSSSSADGTVTAACSVAFHVQGVDVGAEQVKDGYAWVFRRFERDAALGTRSGSEGCATRALARSASRGAVAVARAAAAATDRCFLTGW